jgi:Thermolysin metallopeptidase, alpha-helical domain
MKTCPYCRAQLPDDALRCQHCTSWLDQAAQKSEDKSRVVYILDQDLVRFGKFAAAILGIMILLGVYLFSFDLKDTAKEIRTVREDMKKERENLKTESELIKAAIAEMEKSKKEIETIKNQTSELRSEASAAADKAKAVVSELMKSQETVQGIVSQITLTSGSAAGLVRIEIERHFAAVLPPDKFELLLKSLREGATLAAAPTDRKYTDREVFGLVQADVARAVSFFKSYGIDLSLAPVKIHEDPTFQNVYWDGKTIVFGMGMVNGNLFGPYSSTLALHEATHALFDIRFEGQSGTVAESVCDVVAALISQQWTIGSVRNPNGPPQALRSLKAPGTAYNNSALGKDTQPDHMSGIVTRKTFDDIHVNIGILNKVAYLISEGGEHRGVDVGTGLGIEKTRQLYMEVIKKLRQRTGQKVEFALFKDIVVAAARDVFVAQEDQRVVRESFRAVGL